MKCEHVYGVYIIHESENSELVRSQHDHLSLVGRGGYYPFDYCPNCGKERAELNKGASND